MQANVADSKKLATKLRTQWLNVARKLAHQDGPNGDVKYYMREADENRNLAPEDEIEKLRLVLQNLEYLLQESAPAEPEKAHLAAPSVTSATRCLKYHPRSYLYCFHCAAFTSSFCPGLCPINYRERFSLRCEEEKNRFNKSRMQHFHHQRMCRSPESITPNQY